MFHHIQIGCNALAGRLHLQVRTGAGAMFARWLTQRTVQRPWPAFQQTGMRQTLAGVQAGAVRPPQAQTMRAEGVRTRLLPHADVSQRLGGARERATARASAAAYHRGGAARTTARAVADGGLGIRWPERRAAAQR